MGDLPPLNPLDTFSGGYTYQDNSFTIEHGDQQQEGWGILDKKQNEMWGVPGVPYLEADQVASWKIASQDVTNEKGLTVVPQKSWPAPRHASFSRNFPSRPK